MLTTPSFEPYTSTLGDTFVRHVTRPVQARHARSVSAVLRRRPTATQGRALEVLGHAIEYLIDSRIDSTSCIASRAESAAEQTLMRMSREVFAECREIASADGPISWLLSRLRQLRVIL